MILVDSSVLIDLLEKTPEWFAWSVEQIAAAATRDQLGINALVYAEIARTFSSSSEQNEFLQQVGITYLNIPASAAFAANSAHKAYRAAGGTKTATLPDFFIGAHASVEGFTLMTRDAKRIHTYFPNVPKISPR